VIDFEHVNGAAPEEDGPPMSLTTDALAALVPFLSFEDLFAPEPDAKLIVPALGLAPGPPSGLWGQGYVGKTIVAFSTGLSIATGRDLWGLFGVKKGRWLHLDHEQGRRHTKKRIQRLVAAMGIDPDELRGQMEVSVYPRLNLTTDGAEDLYKRLFAGFDFVTIDALKGVTPGVDENASAVREYIDKLGRASEASSAHVQLIHHAGKTPMQGTRIRKEAGRGSSAIFDAHGTVLVLTASKGEPIHVTHEKDRELGFTLPDFGLRIEDVELDGNPKGGLRVVHLEKEQLSPNQQGRSLDDLVRRVLEVLKTHPDSTKRIVRAECKGTRASDVDAALDEAERKGLATNAGTASKQKWRAI
jgi:hypothetical protein